MHYHQGRAASRGALAPEPPRAHWSGPEVCGMWHEGSMTLPSREAAIPWHWPHIPIKTILMTLVQCSTERWRHVDRSRWVWWRNMALPLQRRGVSYTKETWLSAEKETWHCIESTDRSVLQCVAVCCSVLQCVAMCCPSRLLKKRSDIVLNLQIIARDMNDSKHYQNHNQKNRSVKTLNVDANLWNCQHHKIENKKNLQYGICNYNTSQIWKNRFIIVLQK